MIKSSKDAAAEASVLKARHRRELSRRATRKEREWGHALFPRDTSRSVPDLMDEIASDPMISRALDRARTQAAKGNLISQDDLNREFENDDE